MSEEKQLDKHAHHEAGYVIISFIYRIYIMKIETNVGCG